MDSSSEIICVTGASGYIGSWLVMRLLERGYTVRATVLDPDNMEDVKHLLVLRGAETHMSLWKADLNREERFNEAISGCNGVFHLATPMDFASKDPENIPDDLEVVHFTPKKIKDLGFQFKYKLEDLFTAAVDTCREKGLLPKPTETSVKGTIDYE